jgi:hypothetical protein
LQDDLAKFFFELLADDLIDPVMVDQHLGAVRQAEQWMKVSS